MYVLIVYIVIGSTNLIYTIQGQFTIQECQARATAAVQQARAARPDAGAVTYQCTMMAG